MFKTIVLNFNWLPVIINFFSDIALPVNAGDFKLISRRALDKILELTDSHVVGLKNVSMNEPFFVGHFPGAPVMPGVLIVEAMAQAGGILALSVVPDPENYLTFFLKMNNVKFKKQVIPGDTLIFDLVLDEPMRRGICIMHGKAYVNGILVAEAELMAKIVKTKNL